MDLLNYVGTVAAICTTGAFLPQIAKIRKQGGEDLFYPMLFIYLTGILLWLIYGLLLHAASVVWANSVTLLLVLVAIFVKGFHQAGRRSP